MQIFKSELDDGLEHKIQSLASICYASVAEPCSQTNRLKHIKSLASYSDADLYYIQSILVSSSWNKNDDIFDIVNVGLGVQRTNAEVVKIAEKLI